MGRYTCAYNCESSSDSDVKCFKFPLYNPRKLKKWLDNMRWKDWTPSRFSVLCINHFEERYIDRTGKSVTLSEDAVPTIFSSPDDTRTRKVRMRLIDGKIKNQLVQLVFRTRRLPEAQKSDKWRIIVDEGLMRIESFPHFFHGDYCLPQVRCVSETAITGIIDDIVFWLQVKEPWQWLGLDVRGVLPETTNGNKYILTVTDYYSKWVEAVPMQSCLPLRVAKHIADIVAHFGYPLGILSRLPHHIVHKVSVRLQPNSSSIPYSSLVYYTFFLEMVSDLIEEHAADWDVFLPAKVFSLCFKEHTKTKERPFSLLCCGELEPAHSPRGQDVREAFQYLLSFDKLLSYRNCKKTTFVFSASLFSLSMFMQRSKKVILWFDRCLKLLG
uniref:THAP domain-containing protein 1 n=1 Tax=Scophthalmus maximus TaxID=52904 RepID=A0A8D3A879_SCOMX